MNHLVSVYIPTRNRSSLLEKAIFSIINQSYSNLELIICNDASTDNTRDTVIRIKEQHKNVKIIYLENETTKGACFSRNRCINESSGYFLTGLDDDDYFLLNRIDLFLKYYQEKENEVFCSNIFFKNNQFKKKWYKYEGDISFLKLRYGNFIGNQVFARRDCFLDLGSFDTTFSSWQDYDLWYRMVKKFGACYRINEATYVMNVDAGRKRITTGGKAHSGYLSFIDKHKISLNDSNKKSLLIRDLINRNEIINFTTLLYNFSLGNAVLAFKNNTKIKFPIVEKIIYFLKIVVNKFLVL
ncbi:MAG: glycosyltransferase [Candidatus Malihini olakiniferum]